MTLTNEPHKVLVFVPDPTATLVDFDRILIQKSTTGTSGDYQDLLWVSAQPAELTGTKKEGFNGLNGKDFTFKADGVEYTVSFTTEYSAADVATRINAVTGLPVNDAGGYVRIQSGTSGMSSTLEIHESSEAGVILGFYSGTYDQGRDLWTTIVAGTRLYTITDPHSDNDYWYRYIFVNSTTYARSEESAPFNARPLGAIDPSYLIYGTGVIADLEGNPVAGKKIVVYNRYVPTVVDGALLDGPEAVIYETDEQGLIAIPFIHGSKVSIGIEDTKLRRDVDVPTSGDSFDLLDQSVLDDRLGITYYPIVDGERTTL